MEASRVSTGANNKKRRRWKKCRWTHEEDKLLTELVKRHGPWNWSFIADHIRGRTGMSCRLRWLNHLNPRVDKMPFSKEEQERLLHLHQEFGSKWSAIASFFPRRTDNQLKNQYHTLVGSRNMKVSSPSSSTSHQVCLNKVSIDLSCDLSLSILAVGSQFSDVVQPGNKSSVCVPCLTSMPDKTKMPLLSAGSSSTYGRDTHSYEIINHGIVYANVGRSNGDSMISDARSAVVLELCPVPQPQQGACVEKCQFIDFLGVRNSE